MSHIKDVRLNYNTINSNLNEKEACTEPQITEKTARVAIDILSSNDEIFSDGLDSSHLFTPGAPDFLDSPRLFGKYSQDIEPGSEQQQESHNIDSPAKKRPRLESPKALQKDFCLLLSNDDPLFGSLDFTNVPNDLSPFLEDLSPRFEDLWEKTNTISQNDPEPAPLPLQAGLGDLHIQLLASGSQENFQVEQTDVLFSDSRMEEALEIETYEFLRSQYLASLDDVSFHDESTTDQPIFDGSSLNGWAEIENEEDIQDETTKELTEKLAEKQTTELTTRWWNPLRKYIYTFLQKHIDINTLNRWTSKQRNNAFIELIEKDPEAPEKAKAKVKFIKSLRKEYADRDKRIKIQKENAIQNRLQEAGIVDYSGWKTQKKHDTILNIVSQNPQASEQMISTAEQIQMERIANRTRQVKSRAHRERTKDEILQEEGYDNSAWTRAETDDAILDLAESADATKEILDIAGQIVKERMRRLEATTQRTDMQRTTDRVAQAKLRANRNRIKDEILQEEGYGNSKWTRAEANDAILDLAESADAPKEILDVAGKIVKERTRRHTANAANRDAQKRKIDAILQEEGYGDISKWSAKKKNETILKLASSEKASEELQHLANQIDHVRKLDQARKSKQTQESKAEINDILQAEGYEDISNWSAKKKNETILTLANSEKASEEIKKFAEKIKKGRKVWAEKSAKRKKR